MRFVGRYRRRWEDGMNKRQACSEDSDRNSTAGISHQSGGYDIALSRGIPGQSRAPHLSSADYLTQRAE
jgi:hypothetical protein